MATPSLDDVLASIEIKFQQLAEQKRKLEEESTAEWAALEKAKAEYVANQERDLQDKLFLVEQKRAEYLEELRKRDEELEKRANDLSIREALFAKLEDAEKQLQQEREFLTEKELLLTAREATLAKVTQHTQQQSTLKIVRLNVGGHCYETSHTSLQADPTSMLAAMFSESKPLIQDEAGRVFIDRDGRYFGIILNWLRTGRLPHKLTRDMHESLTVEADYYQLNHLCEALKEQRCERSRQIGLSLLAMVFEVRADNTLPSVIAQPGQPLRLQCRWTLQPAVSSEVVVVPETEYDNVVVYSELECRSRYRVLAASVLQKLYLQGFLVEMAHTELNNTGERLPLQLFYTVSKQ